MIRTPDGIRTEVPQRLGRNHGSYHGETIDIAAVVEECRVHAARHGFTQEVIVVPDAPSLLALTRPALSKIHRRVYVSAGIHGDEPGGPLAVRELLAENSWPADLELCLLPCLNPTGFPLNRRENANGLDLNRQYRQTTAAETAAHIAWLDRQPRYDFSLCLHEDWESQGFYVYELNPENQPSLAVAMVAAVEKVCPVDMSDVIEGRSATRGIIRPSVDPASRPEWPEAFYLLNNKTRLSYTLEAPSDFALSVRVAALTAAVRTALRALPAR